MIVGSSAYATPLKCASNNGLGHGVRGGHRVEQVELQYWKYPSQFVISPAYGMLSAMPQRIVPFHRSTAWCWHEHDGVRLPVQRGGSRDPQNPSV